MIRRATRLDHLVLTFTVLVQLVVLYWPRAAGGGVPFLDKVVHAAVFGAVAWAGVRAGLAVRTVAALLVAHAVVSELVQAWLLPGRSGDPADSLADVVGVGLGLLAAGVRPGASARSRASWRDDDQPAAPGHHAGGPDAGRHPGAG